MIFSGSRMVGSFSLVWTQSPDGLNFADPGLSQLAATVWDGIVTDKPEDGIFGSLVLAKAIAAGNGMIEKTTTSGGKTFEFTIEFAVNSTFHEYGELDVLDTNRVNIFTAAQYNQRIHAGTVVYTDLEQLQTEGDNGKIADYIGAKLENGKNSHLNDLNAAFFNSSVNTIRVNGLPDLIPVNPLVGAVGGIDPAAWPFWRSQQASGAKTTTAGDNLRSSWTQIYDQCSRGGASKEAPTDIITDRASFELAQAQLVPYERYNKDSGPNMSGERGANLGFDNEHIMFKQARVQYDEMAGVYQPGNAYFFRADFLQFCYLKGGWMKLKGDLDLPTQLGSVNQVATYGNLASGNRRRLGIVSGLT
jgi:hypothetical protein